MAYKLWAIVLVGAFTAGCGDSPGTMSVQLPFAAKVGTADFSCNTEYAGLGTDNTSLNITDFRFYVHNIQLRNGDGVYVDLALDDTSFQSNGLALLDFENCAAMGNTETNTMVTGSIAAGEYDGVRFTLGVPFDLNHDNPATAASPLNLQSMQWNWQGGYKFIRIDSGSFGMTDWRFHLGSTGCDGDQLTGGTTSCANANRVDVELAGFNPDSNVVVADLANLVADAAVATNQAMTPFGCMSGGTDMDCAPIFERLGLSFAGSTAGTQSFFRME